MNPNKSLLDLIYVKTPDLTQIQAQMEKELKDLLSQIALIYLNLPELNKKTIIREIGYFENKLNLAYKNGDLTSFKAGITELRDFVTKRAS